MASKRLWDIRSLERLCHSQVPNPGRWHDPHIKLLPQVPGQRAKPLGGPQADAACRLVGSVPHTFVYILIALFALLVKVLQRELKKKTLRNSLLGDFIVQTSWSEFT